MRRILQSLLLAIPILTLALVLLNLSQPASGEPTKFVPQIDKLEHQGYAETVPGSKVKFEMVPIPGGTFMMGSPATEKGRKDDEGPQHPVKIRPFWMGKAPVTWDEFDVYWKPDDLELMQGSWVADSYTVDGKAVPDKELKSILLSIKKDQATFTRVKESAKGSYKLDTAKEPRELDIAVADGPDKGKIKLAIYEIKDNIFTICLASPGKERPKELASNPGSGTTLESWIRPESGNADAITRPTPPYVDETYGHGRERHPALCMTHHAALEYCRWLSQKTGTTYRLPTEAEWEYACRAGTTTAYYFGDDPKQLGDYAWFAGNSAPGPKGDDKQTHPVATKKPNPWGLYDMGGNIMQWCLDHYQKDWYSTFPKDKLALWPVNLPTDKRFSHVARGGSWSDDAARCRSAARRGSNPSWIKDDPQRPQSIWWLTRFDTIGFRIVRPLEEQDNLKGLRSKVTVDSD